MDYQGHEHALSLGVVVFAVLHCSPDLYEGDVPMLLHGEKHAALQRNYIGCQLATTISVSTSYGWSLEYSGC